jgi:hypothetical protein
MWKRMLGVGLAAAGVVAGVSACEVSQINWADHYYVVSPVCAPAPTMTPGGVTLHNGSGTIGVPGTAGGTSVTLEGVHEGDVTHDGIQDAVVLVNCHDTIGGNNNGSEIQVFTRDGQPVQRLVAPQKYPGGVVPDFFVWNQIQIIDGTLYTGVDSYLPADSHANPSAHDVYRWDWNGRTFTPVDLPSTVALGGAKVTLPAGWVAEALGPSSPGQVAPDNVWCLMPHSRPTPTAEDASGCTIAFTALPRSAAVSVDTPGGYVSNPEYCDPRQPQTITQKFRADTTFGNRSAVNHRWLYSCADGTSFPVEQYVVPDAPGYVLYSSQATSAVNAVMTDIAQSIQLPAASAH